MKQFVVGTLIEVDGEILVLKRTPDVKQPNQWGLPAGIVREDEKHIDTAIREVKEETGYKAKPNQFKFIMEFVWDFTKKIVVFPVYRIKLKEQFDVKIFPLEHVDYMWINPKELYKRKDLIHGFYDLIEKIYF